MGIRGHDTSRTRFSVPVVLKTVYPSPCVTATNLIFPELSPDRTLIAFPYCFHPQKALLRSDAVSPILIETINPQEDYPMNDMQREQVGLFRFGVIGTLISGELAHGELKARIQQLCSRRYTIPFSHKATIGFGTIEEWLHNYRTRGFEGLIPAVRSDKGCVRHVRPELKEAIIDLKKNHPKLSVRSILGCLVEKNHMKPNEVSKTTVYRILGIELSKRLSSITGKEQKRFVHRYPNQCWQGDVMHGPYIKDQQCGKARKTYLVAFIDDASRLIVGSEFFFAETSANIKTILRNAVLTYGVPSKLYLDNGRNFCADDIRIACAKMSTALIHTTPYYPQGKGKIERWFRTVRSSFLPWLKSIHSLRELNSCFNAWLQDQYNRMPHSSLENATPLDTFLKRVEGRLRRLPKHIDETELFCRKETRIVTKDGTFRINNILYEAEEQLIGKKITVLFDQDDPTHSIKVFDGNCFIHSATPIDYIANAHYKRKKLNQ